MAEKTTNYELVKPLPEEFYDVAVQNENMDKIDAALNALQKNKAELVNGKINPEQIPFAGIPIVQTQGDGAAYTASAEGITELTIGTAIIMIPHSTSAVNAPTLDLNGLGAKTIRRAISATTSGAALGHSQGWITANRPMLLIYNGTYWVDQGRTKPYASDLSGTVGIEQGGTGATTAAAALTNLGAAAASHSHAAGDIGSGTLGSDRLPTIPVSKGGTGATTAASALTNLGAAAASHNHAAGSITSGTLSSDRLPTVPVTKGGTGATTAAAARTNLGIADCVTSQGTSGNWRYRQWASGWKECWMHTTVSIGATTTWDNTVFTSASYSFAIPITLSAIKTIAGTAGQYQHIINPGINSSKVSFQLACGHSMTGSSADVLLYVAGT